MTAEFSATDLSFALAGSVGNEAADDTLYSATDPIGAAHEHIAQTALRDTGNEPRQVGLELEYHLVDLARPEQRPTWAQVLAAVAALPPMPSGSSVTVEPGGQVELSTPPTLGVAASVAALQADRVVLQTGLNASGYGAAPLGSDPARATRRINPNDRYVAMERHFEALGCAAPGRAMMTATAALQVNLDAGPRAGWSERLGRIRDLGPVLVAVSACSPLLAGKSTGWRSMRQQAWHGIDQRRTGPLPQGEPGNAWADYALDAPVMLIDDGDGVMPVTERVPFGDWVRGLAPFHRRPTTADLDYHLTTLFPPIRPRGYLELRCLDAMPDRWWPALAAMTVALIDDDIAADQAAELCEPLRGRWADAARDGLDDPAIRAAALGCVDIASRHCAPELKAEVEAYAELVTRGRTPGDELRERALATSPLSVLEEEAHA